MPGRHPAARPLGATSHCRHDERVRPSEDDPSAADWSSRIPSLARELARAEEDHRRAAAELAEALHQAHAAGLTWTAIADLAGMANSDTARSRAVRAQEPSKRGPSIQWRLTHGPEGRAGVEKPSISITEAARRLGISRVTVYDWIKRGKLQATTDDAGRRRVLLEE